MLVKAIDARSLAKSRPEFVRTSMLLFFNNCADDLEKTIHNLQDVRRIPLKIIFKYYFNVLQKIVLLYNKYSKLYFSKKKRNSLTQRLSVLKFYFYKGS